MNLDSLPSFDEWHAKADRLKKCVDYATSGAEAYAFRQQLSAHLAAHPAAPQGALPVQAPRAWLDCFGEPHRRRGDAMQDADSEPIPLYASPADAAPVPQEVRMLTQDEREEVFNKRTSDPEGTENIAVMLQRKFCEVNGLTIPAKEQHVCGLQGFGQSLDDECPACRENRRCV